MPHLARLLTQRLARIRFAAGQPRFVPKGGLNLRGRQRLSGEELAEADLAQLPPEDRSTVAGLTHSDRARARQEAYELPYDPRTAPKVGTEPPLDHRDAPLRPGKGGSPRKRLPKQARSRSVVTEPELRILSERDLKGAVRDFVAAWESLPPTSEYREAARGGSMKRGWYERSGKALVRLFGSEAPRFVALLAATSANTPVQENLRKALHTWKLWREYLDARSRQGITRPPTPDELRAEMARWYSTGTAPQAAPFPAHDINTVRALTARNPASTTKQLISGPKVESFRRNLLGQLQAATLDTWMAQFGGVGSDAVGGRSRGGLSTFDTAYVAHSAKLRKVAAQLTREDRRRDPNARPWSAAEVQETVWSFMMALARKVESSREPGQGPPLSGVQALDELTHGDVDAEEDFLSLLVSNKEQYAGIRSLAEDLGLGKTLDELRQDAQRSRAERAPSHGQRAVPGDLSPRRRSAAERAASRIATRAKSTAPQAKRTEQTRRGHFRRTEESMQSAQLARKVGQGLRVRLARGVPSRNSGFVYPSREYARRLLQERPAYRATLERIAAAPDRKAATLARGVLSGKTDLLPILHDQLLEISKRPQDFGGMEGFLQDDDLLRLHDTFRTYAERRASQRQHAMGGPRNTRNPVLSLPGFRSPPRPADEPAIDFRGVSGSRPRPPRQPRQMARGVPSRNSGFVYPAKSLIRGYLDGRSNAFGGFGVGPPPPRRPQQMARKPRSRSAEFLANNYEKGYSEDEMAVFADMLEEEGRPHAAARIRHVLPHIRGGQNLRLTRIFREPTITGPRGDAFGRNASRQSYRPHLNRRGQLVWHPMPTEYPDPGDEARYRVMGYAAGELHEVPITDEHLEEAGHPRFPARPRKPRQMARGVPSRNSGFVYPSRRRAEGSIRNLPAIYNSLRHIADGGIPDPTARELARRILAGQADRLPILHDRLTELGVRFGGSTSLFRLPETVLLTLHDRLRGQAERDAASSQRTQRIMEDPAIGARPRRGPFQQLDAPAPNGPVRPAAEPNESFRGISGSRPRPPRRPQA